MEERLHPLNVVKHFKRETIDNPKSKYLYEIMAFGTGTEDDVKYVVYRALYTDVENGININDVFIRPYDMFMSEVDHEKYPDIKQKYRFELFTGDDNNDT